MGYDISRFVTEVYDDLQCAICLNVLKDAVQTKYCAHAFCKECIDEWLQRKQMCPLDRKYLSREDLEQLPLMVRRMLDKLKIKCDY
ncbi:E3 ubiquitin-protein ligase NRDP1-like protein, partial [Dinothrombium tinctorium]